MAEDWNEVKKKLQGIAPEKISQMVRRCPQCNELSLVFDVKTKRLYCTKCGFEEHLTTGGIKE